MADPQDIIDPKEATEAKLCAYLEGELQPAERAEIEQHLLANPQHRQLLADLARTREWMRTIPSEASPVDLAEMFQGQVERSMLLDDQKDSSAGMMVRWPAFAMVAAIVLLMGGLSVLIYAMLKGPAGGLGKNYAISSGKTAASTTLPVDHGPEMNSPMASAKPVDLSTAPSITPVPGLVSLATPSAEVSPPAVPPMPAPLIGTGLDRPDLGMNVHSLNRPDLEQVKNKLNQVGYRLPADRKAVCLVVSTDAMNSAQEQTRGFFQRHQLAFDDATTASTTQLNFAARNAPAVLLKDSKNPDAAPSTQPVDESIYVSHDLTPLQVELLAASLATDNLNQSVQRLTLSDGPAAVPTTLPIDALTKGQVLTITVAQLVGPGIDKTNVVKVNDEGTISLPMIDPVLAAGIPAAELEQRIADKYRETNLIQAATVTVATGNNASTQPSTTQSATMPTTRSAVLTTQNVLSPSGVDVIVIIDKSTGTLPGK